MALNIIPLLALVVGLYLIFQTDKQSDGGAKALYAFAGVVAVLWSLFTVLGAYTIRLSAMPLAFGLFALATIYTKGATRAVSGAVALLLFLVIIL